jgi:YD repeat-containing protein
MLILRVLAPVGLVLRGLQLTGQGYELSSEQLQLPVDALPHRPLVVPSWHTFAAPFRLVATTKDEPGHRTEQDYDEQARYERHKEAGGNARTERHDEQQADRLQHLLLRTLR